MDVMRTGASVLGTLEPELSFDQQRDVADRLLAAFPAIMTYWYRFTHEGQRIDCNSDEPTIGGHFPRPAPRQEAQRAAREGDERLADPLRRA